MHVKLMKSESCLYLALQDFTHLYRIPHTIKTDNARTKVGIK